MNEFEALGNQRSIAVVELDVIGGRCSQLESKGVPDHKCDRFCLGFANGLAGTHSAVAAMEKFMRNLVNQRSEFLRRRLTRQQSNPSSIGNAQSRSDLFVVFENNVLLREEVDQAVPVGANFAGNAVIELWQVGSVGLALVLSRDLRPRFYAPM